MKAFNTLVDAINYLKQRGYNLDFNLKENVLECSENGARLTPKDFEIVEVYRFEGMTNPEDQTILYAIESKDGMKGVWVNGYGIYADPMSAEMVEKLKIHH